MKKHDQPYMPFYFGDWFKAPEIRALSPAARCLWFEMLGLMWESTERGYLTLAGKPIEKETLGRMLGFADVLLDLLLAEMERFNVFSRRDDGAIYNRRMVRDAEISKIRAEAGKKGGFCSGKSNSKTQANDTANSDIDTDIDTEDATEVPKDNKELGTISPLISEVIEYFNDKLGTRDTTKSRQINGFISGREKDGYGLADFKKVIDGRITAWKNDPKMSEFLRPSTLFSPTNFEQYLNAPVANNPLSLAVYQEKLNARQAAKNAQG